ncbi:MAG: hypothetical protein MUC36_18855 [Planctomycetes bacterium]|jgi:hypothetical protein|nr:hypothetical protein [Planctomycetota bacterium]
MDPEVIVQFGRLPNRIDLIGGLRTVPFDLAWGGRIEFRVALDGSSVPVWIVSLEDLKRSKREAGRPKDLEDLRHLP